MQDAPVSPQDAPADPWLDSLIESLHAPVRSPMGDVHGSSPRADGGGPRDAGFYDESWVPVQYARKGFGPGFEFVAGYLDPARYDQACVALRRLP